MPPIDRADLATQFLEGLPYVPYPLQEEAILSWFTADQGVLVCAPTGTGKTLIAHAALFEALHSGTVAYYTTPLIALTEQKFAEVQAAAVRWGFKPEDVGLITGNRKVNPDARILVVVAEILLNRLLQPEGLDWSRVSSVVMDEFHSFADPQRGIVWELSLAMLPRHVRLMLLSATVGNAHEFLNWLKRCHERDVELVEGTERKVPLTYHWIPDMLLGEQVVEMCKGPPEVRHAPMLVFCFNRDECWSVAEMLKGLDVMHASQRQPLLDAVEALPWSQGVGPKLKQMLRRGVGVHHAGMLPLYRRVVEELFEKKLLSVCVCTETLAAGINLPARTVLLTSLVKGPFGAEKLIDASTAHQIFGRAGRPQYDTQGHVYSLAHEDDVRMLRWKRQFDLIPEDTKDPQLIRKKKELKRKKPERSATKKYWTDLQFEQLKAAPPGKLYSKGPVPWRLLAYLLKVSPEVSRLRTVVRKRLLDGPRVEAGLKTLDGMLRTLHELGYVRLEPEPPETPTATPTEKPPPYEATMAHATPALDRLLVFRSVHPLYGAWLVDQLGSADRIERIQALESVLELPRPILKFVRVPWELPVGPLATERLDPELINRGLMVAQPPPGEAEEEEEPDFSFGRKPWEDRPPLFAEKLKLYFDALRPDVTDVTVTAAWAAGSLLEEYGGNFELFVRARDLTKQEGIIFRHCLRLILLCNEFMELAPTEGDAAGYLADLRDIQDRLTETCRKVDPTSTEETIKRPTADVVEGEKAAAVEVVTEVVQPPAEEFGAGLWD